MTGVVHICYSPPQHCTFQEQSHAQYRLAIISYSQLATSSVANPNNKKDTDFDDFENESAQKKEVA
jgi:hypothetical protein